MKTIKTILLLLVISSSTLWAQDKLILSENETNYPIPPANEQLMFYIQRSMNANTIAYELNLDKNGRLDTKSPIHPYWIRYEEDGRHKELTYIEKRFAYGIECEKAENGESYHLRLVSYPLDMELRKNKKGNYQVFIKVNHREMILNRVYFKTEGGSFWNPAVKYFHIYGIDKNTHQKVVEQIKPK